MAEIIIVDDCSTDNSFELAQRLKEKSQLIRCVALEKNSGPAAARNFGALVAFGKYVSFLDADDEFIGDFFGAALDLFGEDEKFRAVKGDMDFFDPIKGAVLPDYDCRYNSVVLSSACALIVKSDDFRRFGGFPLGDIFRGPQGGEDVAFMQVVMKYLAPLGRVKKPLYRVWSNAESHLDKFLCTTRLTGNGFEFIQVENNLTESNGLMRAISAYLKNVESCFSELDCK